MAASVGSTYSTQEIQHRHAMDASHYAASERLRNGAMLHVRALRPDDRVEMLASVERFSKQSLYRRFFAPKRSFSEREIEFFLNVDFANHVALVAVLAEDGQQVIVGGARYIVTRPGSAEIAFAIDDPHQRLGIAPHLINHLIQIGRAAALEVFVAEVLPENMPMLKVFERCGLAMTICGERGITHVTLTLSQSARN